MRPNPITDAIGTLKLTGMHLNNPTAIGADVVQDASTECIQRLESIDTRSLDLVGLYCALLNVLPLGWLPYVTITNDRERPYGAAIANEAGYVFCRYVAKSQDGLVALIKARIGLGPAGLE